MDHPNLREPEPNPFLEDQYDQGGGPVFFASTPSIIWNGLPVLSGFTMRCDDLPRTQGEWTPRYSWKRVWDRARLRASGSIPTTRSKRNTAFVFKAMWDLILQIRARITSGFPALIRRNSDKEFTEVQPSAGWDANPGSPRMGVFSRWGPWPAPRQWVQGEPASSRFHRGHQVQQLLALALDSHSKGGTGKLLTVLH